MADLVTLDAFADFLGTKADVDVAVRRVILDAVEGVLESQTGQTFKKAETIIDEPHDGSGTSILKLDRPPVTVDAAIKVGQVVATPDSTIPATDIIVDQTGSRIIYEGSRLFKRGTRNIFVSYTSAANLPGIARLAVQEGAAFLYRRRGAEHVTGQSIGELGSVTFMAAQLARLPAWQLARSQLDRFVFA